MKLGLRKNRRRRDPNQYGPGHLVMEKVGCLETAYDVIEVDPVHHETIRTVAKNVSEREAERMTARDPERFFTKRVHTMKKPAKKSAKKSKKFERCVLAVKHEQKIRPAYTGRGKGRRVKVNPWAVCHAAMGKKAYARDPQNTEVTPVLFRMFDGEVLALFPTHHEGRGFVSSYAHMGQHGAADFGGVVRTSRPATPAEYTSLKRELERIGYKLKVMKRASRTMHARDPKKTERKTRDLYILQGNYGYGHGWEDLTAAETRKEIVGYRKDYRENEPGTPLRILHKQERIQLRLPGVRDPGRKKKPGKKRHSKAVMALAKKYAQARVKRRRS